MPAGISWGQYLKFMSCAILSMMAGSQLVHEYYRPLADLDLYINQEMQEAKLTDTPQLEKSNFTRSLE